MASTISIGSAFVLSLATAGVGCGGAGEQKRAVQPVPAAEEPRESPVKLAGVCVDPVADGDHHDASRPFDKHVQLEVHSEDLDSDGVVDEFVMPAWSCGLSCTRSAYVMRGTCGHYVGSFPSTDRWEALDHKSNGLRDLSTRPRASEEDGQIHCYQAVLAYDGTQYRETKRRECECKDEGAKCTAW